MFCSANGELLAELKELVALCGIGTSRVIAGPQSPPLRPRPRHAGLPSPVERALRPAPGSLTPPARSNGSTAVRAHLPHGQGHGLPGPHERDARIRPDRVHRVGRRRDGLRHRGAAVITTSWPRVSSSTTPKSSSTATGPTSRPRACCSATWTPRCASTPRSCSAGSAPSSRPTTTSSPRSTRRCGRAARSSTCRPVSRSTCRCRRTSGSTPRTWASSSGRSSSPTRAPRCTTSRGARRRCTRPTRCTRRWSSSWRCPGRGSPTRPSRTGRTTSTTS